MAARYHPRRQAALGTRKKHRNPECQSIAHRARQASFAASHSAMLHTPARRASARASSPRWNICCSGLVASPRGCLAVLHGTPAEHAVVQVARNRGTWHTDSTTDTAWKVPSGNGSAFNPRSRSPRSRGRPAAVRRGPRGASSRSRSSRNRTGAVVELLHAVLGAGGPDHRPLRGWSVWQVVEHCWNESSGVPPMYMSTTGP